MKWQVRLLKNSVLAVLPGRRLLRKVKRSVVPYPADIDQWTLEQGLRMLEMLSRSGIHPRGRVALELGTGWKPVIPILFALAGFKKILLLDSERFLDGSLLARVVENLREYTPLISSRMSVDPSTIRDRLSIGSSVNSTQMLAALGLEYVAPADARFTGLPSRSVDVIFSRAVLEHIPVENLRSILAEFRRIIASDGGMCQIIDNGDHWAQDDESISKVHFLKFDDVTWRWIGMNSIDYQNRLRHSDYLQLLTETGFEVVLDGSQPDKAAMAALRDLPLANRFRGKSLDDLSILTSYLVAKPVETLQ
jgi:hypothetical protein